MNASAEYLADGMLVLNKSVKLPDVLDMLIVGGGPAGTTAAFRAKELGLSALVIDYDDLMKRIRDYAKDKLILPDFGGGDKMKFPKGDRLVSSLHFSAIDKDEMCVQWKGFYREHNVPAQAGMELTGLQHRDDGSWQVKTYNHNVKAEQFYAAKHVVIGIGRGVPRRFDIPGNTDGIAYRLADAAAYVGEPVCILGGGTSAAEAVIEISKAKAKANDPTAVHWSYRSEKLPKVSKALADVYFEAYTANGNIRNYPRSEPVAVVTAEDRKEYLSVRTDRRAIPGRPNETSHLEFSKEYCIACIGEDIPEAFLNSIGIQMVIGGQANKKRMAVTPLLESQQPNVYLIGDILSQVYLETDDFNADPSTFLEKKHRGNIKSALIDGVLVAEVAAQKVAGKKQIDVQISFEEDAARRPVPAEVMKEKGKTVIETIFESAAPVSEVIEQAYLVKVLAGSVEEDEFSINMNSVTTIGKKFCDLVFPEDAFLSDRHASISHGKDGYSLRDDGSSTGVFLRAQEGNPLQIFHGNLVRLGRQFLLFHLENGSFSFNHYDQTGKQRNRYQLLEKTIVLGREAPDITLDKKDMTLSRRHVSIAVKEGKVFIKDLKSVNGTYLKVDNAVKIEPGDQFRVGQQILKLSLQEEKIPSTVHVTTKPPPPPAEPKIKPPTPVSAPPAKRVTGVIPEAMTIAFKNVGKSIAFEKGQTICDVAEKNGVKISAECHAGICGSDPIRILSGKENLNAMGDEEKGTLEDICGVEAGQCRLACMVKPTGGVEIDILEQ